MAQFDGVQEQLTARDRDILRLMAAGLSNREIAERLVLAQGTVKWYVNQIYSKLDAHSRDEALLRAQESGLLEALEAQTATRHNLPVQLTSFIGRRREIERVKELLARTRLLTLSGPGGTGKTRLALRVAEMVGRQYAEGAHFVDLAPLSDASLVAGAIANVLGVYERADEPQLDTLKRALGSRDSLLLLLDNFEHLIEAAVILLELLAAAPKLKIMVTSREALRVSGERVFDVPPLTVPEAETGVDIETLTEVEAVVLFIQRAEALKRGFRITADNAADVIEICQRLDGLPLAIELAAAQSRFLTPSAIREHMDARFRVLTGGVRDAPARQQTLRATIDWSYDLLSDDEKSLFARLAVFRGGRSLEAIEAVCGDGLAADVFDGLAALVDKNMVRQIEDRLGEPRFVMLETLHEYALERLEESGEAQDIRKRHAKYFAELAEHANPNLKHAEFDYWFKKLEIEYDNLRVSLDWSLYGGEVEVGLRIVAALGYFWFAQGYHIEAQRWAEQAFEHLDDAPFALRAGVLETAARIAVSRQNHETAEVYASETLAIYRELGDQRGAARTLLTLGFSVMSAQPENDDKGVRLIEEGVALIRALDDKPLLINALTFIGTGRRRQGDYKRAKASFEECLALSRELGQANGLALAQSNLGLLALKQGDYDRAEKLLKTATTLMWELEWKYMIANTLPRFAGLFVARDQAERAACLLSAIVANHAAMGIVLQTHNQLDHNHYLMTAHEQLDEATFEAAWNEGRKMSLEAAVAFALGDGG